MKKIAIFIFILSSFMLISCSDDGSGDTEKGYVDPGDWTGKVVSDLKAYAINGVTSCGPNAQCNAIIYQNKLNDTDYVGIAVNDKHETNPKFNFKIYWKESSTTSLPTSGSKSITLSPSEYTIKISQGNNVYTSTNDNLNITISYDETNQHYTTTFTTNNIVIEDPEDSSTFTINNGNSITAVKYP